MVEALIAHPGLLLCLAALPALIAAIALWRGGAATRWTTSALLIAVAAAPTLTPDPRAACGPAITVIALPILAALRRSPPAMVDEARVGGAGWALIFARLILPLAAPGLAVGVALALAGLGHIAAWQLVAAATIIFIQK